MNADMLHGQGRLIKGHLLVQLGRCFKHTRLEHLGKTEIRIGHLQLAYGRSREQVRHMQILVRQAVQLTQPCVRHPPLHPH